MGGAGLTTCQPTEFNDKAGYGTGPVILSYPATLLGREPRDSGMQGKKDRLHLQDRQAWCSWRLPRHDFACPSARMPSRGSVFPQIRSLLNCALGARSAGVSNDLSQRHSTSSGGTIPLHSSIALIARKKAASQECPYDLLEPHEQTKQPDPPPWPARR